MNSPCQESKIPIDRFYIEESMESIDTVVRM